MILLHIISCHNVNQSNYMSECDCKSHCVWCFSGLMLQLWWSTCSGHLGCVQGETQLEPASTTTQQPTNHFHFHLKETQACWLQSMDQLRWRSARRSMTGRRWRCWYSPKWDCQVSWWRNEEKYLLMQFYLICCPECCLGGFNVLVWAIIYSSKSHAHRGGRIL